VLAVDRLSQRQPFVGRESELRQLRAAFEAAATGDGRLILLVGEPGIGKTALSDQLCRFVATAGGRALVGHCYEEGSFRPPYQPFVEVLGTYLHELDIATLHAELGSSAADLVRIVPMLRERLRVSPLSPGDAEEDRWRLLQAATDMLRSAATKQPLLVVLEDLHDADSGTLDLLLYLARNLHGARILVVGTYRDVEVDRAHPLSAALSELHRASNVARMPLRGLSTDEVQHLLAETSQQTIPQPFAELVHRQTEGNPLFVHETLRFVIESGLVEQHAGTLRRVGDRSLAGRIPEGLRDAVGKRLSRLGETTNRVLSVASVIGREFRLDVLRQVLADTDEEVESALGEALTAALIEEQSSVGATITYRFKHAFFRQTLYDEMVAPRRIRLHQQVAQALEEAHAHRLDEHAAELAEHYSFYSDTLNLAKAVEYGEIAAKRAVDAFAYGEAARLLERTLVVQELVEPEDKAHRCDLMLALGEALFLAGETQRVVSLIAPHALSLAERVGDRSRAFRACRLAIDCLDAQGAANSTAMPEYHKWSEQASLYAEADSIERAHADVALANALSTQGRLEEARRLHLEALAVARRHADPEAQFKCAFYLMNSEAPRFWEERLRLADECASWQRDGVSGRSLAVVLCCSGSLRLATGQRSGAEELWRQVEELAQRTHVVTATLFVPQRDVILAIVDGHLDDAMTSLPRFVERGEELGAPVRARTFGLTMLFTPALHLGRPETWLAAFEQVAVFAKPYSVGPSVTALRAICLAQLGRTQEGRALVLPLLDAVADSGTEDEWVMVAQVALLQAAVVFGHRPAADALSQRLACVAHLSIGDWFYSCVARHLGDAAALLNDRTAARAYYRQALEAAGKIRFRPELALTHLRLAEVLLEDTGDGTRLEALEHLDIALPELQDMKMQPALERALALKNQFEAAAKRLPGRQSASDTLTAREREIASLVADGMSNREIAEKLVISEGTVDVHVKHILGKLGFRSRAQVAGWFARQGPG
jgi:DNA-binding CsgD family transcriptional regulator